MLQCNRLLLALVVAVCLAAPPAYAQATRTWVSGVGDDANPCSRTAPCKTFAGAISKTAAAGEINTLDPGGFGAVTITKALTIRSDSIEAGVEALGFAKLGDDVLIHSTAVIVDCGRLSLGSRVRIDPFVIISNRGGVEFGDNIHIGGHSVLVGQGAITFGDFVNISHFVGIFTSNEDLSGRVLSHPSVAAWGSHARTKSIDFDRHSAVGAGSVVLPGARFAEGSILGALSRVSRPLKPWTTYVGIPARRIRERERQTLEAETAYRTTLTAPT